jgi:hypothetical protein
LEEISAGTYLIAQTRFKTAPGLEPSSPQELSEFILKHQDYFSNMKLLQQKNQGILLLNMKLLHKKNACTVEDISAEQDCL